MTTVYHRSHTDSKHLLEDPFVCRVVELLSAQCCQVLQFLFPSTYLVSSAEHFKGLDLVCVSCSLSSSRLLLVVLELSHCVHGCLIAMLQVSIVEVKCSESHQQLRVLESLQLMTFHVGFGLVEVIQSLPLPTCFQLSLTQFIVLACRLSRVRAGIPQTSTQRLFHVVDALVATAKTQVVVRQHLIEQTVMEVVLAQPVVSHSQSVLHSFFDLLLPFFLDSPVQIVSGYLQRKRGRRLDQVLIVYCCFGQRVRLVEVLRWRVVAQVFSDDVVVMIKGKLGGHCLSLQVQLPNYLFKDFLVFAFLPACKSDSFNELCGKSVVCLDFRSQLSHKSLTHNAFFIENPSFLIEFADICLHSEQFNEGIQEISRNELSNQQLGPILSFTAQGNLLPELVAISGSSFHTVSDCFFDSCLQVSSFVLPLQDLMPDMVLDHLGSNHAFDVLPDCLVLDLIVHSWDHLEVNSVTVEDVLKFQCVHPDILLTRQIRSKFFDALSNSLVHDGRQPSVMLRVGNVTPPRHYLVDTVEEILWSNSALMLLG